MANSDINNWNLKTSAINLLLYKAHYEKYIFNETMNGKNVNVKKVIYRSENQIKNDTVLTIGHRQQFDIKNFENMQTFYYLHDKYYFCLKDNNVYFSDYLALVIHPLLDEFPNTTSERNLKCHYINGDNRIIFAFINS